MNFVGTAIRTISNAEDFSALLRFRGFLSVGDAPDFDLLFSHQRPTGLHVQDSLVRLVSKPSSDSEADSRFLDQKPKRTSSRSKLPVDFGFAVFFNRVLSEVVFSVV